MVDQAGGQRELLNINPLLDQEIYFSYSLGLKPSPLRTSHKEPTASFIAQKKEKKTQA